MSKLQPNTMTREELSLLLFLESCYVDYGGLVDHRRMNAEDFEIAKRWNSEGLIEFGRLYSKSIFELSDKNNTHFVTLVASAFELAHQERINRAKRMYEKRQWLKASEK
jgi:hypothetical protein